jgi:NAD kinase
MGRLTDRKIVLIIRLTRLDELVSRFNTLAQAKFYVEHLGADFSDYQQEDQTYKSAIRQSESYLGELGRVQVLQRSFLPNFVFGKDDAVVVLGQDGLVANTLKYLNGQPVVAVNPDPARYDGVLLPFKIVDLPRVILEVFRGIRVFKEITMAKAYLNDGQTLLAVNDFFIGVKSHTSARYLLTVGTKTEQQSSSGIIVSTGLGSTGWLKSILAGAIGITGDTTDKFLRKISHPRISWDSNFLYFTVREPFPSKVSSATLVFGRITNKEPMTIVSQTPENGVIFSDGIEADYLNFNSGTTALISINEKKGMLVI